MRRTTALNLSGLLLSLVLFSSVALAADHHVAISLVPAAGRPEKAAGRVIVEDQQGGLLLEDPFGVYWPLEAKDIASKAGANGPFQRANAKDLSESLKSAVDGEAVFVETKNYVIVSRAGRAYATWCGTLLERLRNGFLAHWEREGLELTPSASPLPVLILQNRGQFREYAIGDGAAAAAETYGYYSARTNRVVLYDLTADQGGDPLGDATQKEEITRRLSRAPTSVATVVHEAVHQLAFNSGLQVRYADNPMWVTEGLAMYFETPDFNSGTRWTTAGKVSPWRLEEFRKADQPVDSLATLVQNEDRFRTPETMTAAYAESWVLVHALATRRREQWNKYVKSLREKPPLVFQTPEERLAEFRTFFGDDLAALERDVAKHAAGLARRR